MMFVVETLVPLLDLSDKVITAVATAGSLVRSEVSGAAAVEAELKKLKSKAESVQPLLHDAEQLHHVSDDTSSLWLSKVKAVLFDIQDLSEEYEAAASKGRKRKRAHYCCFYRRISGRISEMNKIYKDVMKEGDCVRRSNCDSTPKQRRLLPETSSLHDESRIVGRLEEKDAIVELLVSAEGNGVPVTCIYGKGELGKTTLARLVFNDVEVRRHFDRRIWVSLNQVYDARRSTKLIIESIRKKKCELLSLDLLQRQLMKLVKQRRFLLVLDNVENEDPQYWESLQAPLVAGLEGSRVLVTTQSQQVVKNMETVHSFKLEALGADDRWLLFQKVAYVDEEYWRLYPNLMQIGREIVRRCGDTPAKVKSVARTLYSETDESKWRSILSTLPEFEVVCYNNLPLHLKHCAAFCSLYPDDYKFDKDELVKLWMALGLAQPCGQRRLEDIAGESFDELLSRHFFQITQSPQNHRQKYEMPPRVYDLLKSVSRYECVRIDGNATHPGKSKRLRYALFCQHSAEPSSIEKVYESKRLRTFILHGDDIILTKQVLCDLFKRLRYLRVLDLSNSPLEKLPDSIGGLVLLRYLSLYKTKIKELPETVANLYNLQTLELGECYALQKLPKGIRNLVNLRHLGLHLDWECRDRETDLSSMPLGMEKLTSLQTLSRFVVSKNGCGLPELKPLNLRGEFCISKLENVASLHDAEKANLKDKQHIHSMMLRWSFDINSNAHDGAGSEEVIENLRPHTNLENLWIQNYTGRKFPDWVQDPSFSNILTIRLSNCKGCEQFPLLGNLPMLRNLHIEGMVRVKSMGDPVGFLALEMLTLSDMPELERLFETECARIPKLNELFISKCPKLGNNLFHVPRFCKVEYR